jgi:hypothetical protein
MALRIGDKAETVKLITWDGGEIQSGTTGEINNIVVLKDEVYCVFNPESTLDMFFVNAKSLKKVK